MNTLPPAELFDRVGHAFKGRFELLQLVASSQERALFLVRDGVLKRRAALRIQLHPDQRYRTWFERETELLAALDHPSIRAVYEAGFVDPWAYRITKWIDGESLADAVQRGPRSIPSVLTLARDLSTVLVYAHSQQIVLRRIVPTNVMLDRSGHALITDLRYANRCVGYADPDPEPSVDAFLAPETWYGHLGEPASDIYAAGAILYFAVTGQAPANDPNAIVPPKVLRESCPQALERVILRSMKLDPRERYLNSTEMCEDLFLELGTYEAPSPILATEFYDSRDWEQRLRRALGDDYELLNELGRGAYGRVYHVRDLRLEREEALKVLHPYLTVDPAVVERFQREAQLAARLRHPNIVDVYVTGGREGLLWYTMAYINSGNIADLVRQSGPLDANRVVRILLESLSALHHAHSHSIVHRDIKPENLLIDEHGHVQITDLGLAMALEGERFGGASSHSGTPAYASPEQLLGEPVDLRSDLYSLSMVAYHALLGRQPVDGGSIESILARQTMGNLPDLRELRPDIPEHLIKTLERGAARYPKDRFANAREYADSLRHLTQRKEPWMRWPF